MDTERRDEGRHLESARIEPSPRDDEPPNRLGPAPGDDYDEAQRVNRTRLALLGLATGAVMALIVLVCVVLLMLVVE